MRTLFFIVLLDAAGFGIVIPIFLFYALELGGSPEQATMIFSVYPLAIILSSSLLGRLSDRYGRKPVLLVSLLVASSGYLLLATANSLLTLVFARFVQGAMAGNMSVAHAYVADVSDAGNRAKAMGKIGAASALGFVVGPAIGAWLGGSSFEGAQLETAAYASAIGLFCAFLGVWFFLPESLSPQQRQKNRELPMQFNPFANVGKTLRRPLLREFILCAFLFNIAGAFADVILPLWLKDKSLINGPSQLTPLFLFTGLFLAIVQARLIGPAAKRIGEYAMFRYGALGYALAILLVTVSGHLGSYPFVIAAWTLAGVSMALFFSGLQSLVSKCAEDHERGSVLGAFSAVGTIGRVIGPTVTGVLYADVSHDAPFFLGAMILLGVALISVIIDKPFIAKR